MKVNFT